MDRLTGAQICAIIKACTKSQVKRLKYFELELEFDTQGGNLGDYVEPGVSENIPPVASKQNGSTELSAPVEFSLEEQAMLEESEKAQLLIDDPAAYEQEMIDMNLGLTQ